MLETEPAAQTPSRKREPSQEEPPKRPISTASQKRKIEDQPVWRAARMQKLRNPEFQVHRRCCITSTKRLLSEAFFAPEEAMPQRGRRRGHMQDYRKTV